MCSSTSNTNMADTPKSTRRSNKPLMERRRRERINHCLNELKNLVLTAQRKDPSRYSKLEKADILEMTVRHVQALHRQDSAAQRTQTSPPADATSKYRAGFSKCASEVSRFLSGVNGLPSDLHARVLSHLSSATNAEYANKAPSIKDEPASPPKYTPKQLSQQAPMAGVPVVEARLATGQLALVVPSWSGVSVSSSPPTNATSPEAAGAPSSPESARGSPHMTPPEEPNSSDHCLNSESIGAIRYSIQSSIDRCSASVTMNNYSSSSTSTSRMQVDHQVAPLDLATSHRRISSTNQMRHRVTTVSVETLPQQQPRVAASAAQHQVPVSNASKEHPKGIPAKGTGQQHLPLKEARHVPYPVHHQNPHWRPW